MTILIVIALIFALLPTILYLRNGSLYRVPPDEYPSAITPAISVLIPARNEENAIAECVRSVLASKGVEVECVVLDDHSTDRTAEIVRELSEIDPRVRLEAAPELPVGWSGKQHACYVLSRRARYPILSFLDADVRLRPDALLRMDAFRVTSGAALVSGFPRQITGTILEKLVIPLIHFLLLGFLPFSRMRKTTLPGLGAGCGQWFLTTRDDYDRVGGHSHERVRGSFHDGIKLPRVYRQTGLMTDLCDVTSLASCRMYRSAAEVWNGFAKNAREGMASSRMILPFTIILTCGQILPFALLAFWKELSFLQLALVCAAVISAWIPRWHGVVRYRQSVIGAVLHPVGVVVVLMIQWYAAIRSVAGRPVGWKGRKIPERTS